MASPPQISHSVKTPVKARANRAFDLQVQRILALRQELTSDPLLDLRTVQNVLGGLSYASLNSLVRRGELKTFRVTPRGIR